MSFIKKISSRLLSKNERSRNVQLNIVFLVLFYGFNLIFTLAIVPFTLKYLGDVEYGIWLTISSFLTWFNYLDFGIGNGLRNKLAEALAKDDKSSAKIYVSTGYAVFSVIVAVFCLVFFFVNNYLPWTSILNVQSISNQALQFITLYVVIFFAIQFLLKLIYSINAAVQKPALNGLISFFVNGITLVFVYILYKYYPKSLLTLSIGSVLIPVGIYFISSLFLFYTRYKSFAPSVKYIDTGHVKDLFQLGLKFFIIQLAGLIIFSTDNIVITQILGPEKVTDYNIVYKLFITAVMIFGVLLNPFWSAFTDAYIKKDFDWIKNTVKKLTLLWLLFSVGIILMIVLSNYIYALWVGEGVVISIYLTAYMGIYAIISNWNNIFAYFLNGVGKIKLQYIFSLLIIVINIPLSILFVKLYSLTGIIAIKCLILFIGSVLTFIQYKKIINKKDAGIWGK